ncbi:MAG: tetratricopeptide repeat protein [Gaiellaceae bacterium]
MVCAPGLDLDVLDGVTELVDQHLIRRRAGTGGEVRFDVLETIREYAHERLRESGEADATRTRHSDHFAALAERGAEELSGPDQAAWLRRLEEEHSNVRAALDRLIEAGAADRALGLADSMWRFWAGHGHMTEGRARLAAALALGGSPGPRGMALRAAGAIARLQGDLRDAERFLAQAIDCAEEAHDELAGARAKQTLGNVAVGLEEFDRAEELFDEALETFRGIGHAAGAAATLSSQGVLARRRGDLANAERIAAEVLELDREAGDERSVIVSLINLSYAKLQLGRTGEAGRLLEEGLELSRGLGDSITTLHCLEDLARVAAAEQDDLRAARLWGAVDRLLGELDIHPSEGDLAERDALIADSRRRLGASAFDAARAAGSALAADEAADSALGDRGASQ